MFDVTDFVTLIAADGTHIEFTHKKVELNELFKSYVLDQVSRCQKILANCQKNLAVRIF